jgi:hypothetical protein
MLVENKIRSQCKVAQGKEGKFRRGLILYTDTPQLPWNYVLRNST